MKAIIVLAALRVTAVALAIAAIFGYRCPVEGCPACRWIGR